jgi:N-acetylglutamate synthase-like GNAT family acetyltransferase
MRTFAVIVAAITLPHAAFAQDSVTNFRLAADPGNITGCIALDSAFTRVHTLTVRDSLNKSSMAARLC